MSPIINISSLLKLTSSTNLVLIDASGGKNARENYNQKHLDGALFVDLETQLSDIKENAARGGRHPLPTVEQFSGVLTSLGISENSHVVIYDDMNGANAASRFWWMLKAAGHEKVQVLNGGIQEAEKIGFPINSNKVVPKEVKPYKINTWSLPISDMKEVEQVSEDPAYRVVDVRSEERYKGLTEPIDLIAGHIPGAVNIPLTSNLDQNGLFKSPEELKEKYQLAFAEINPDHVIIHCGSGVTACHTILAMDYAGLNIPKLYVGSWSEWSRNDKEIVTDKF